MGRRGPSECSQSNDGALVSTVQLCSGGEGHLSLNVAEGGGVSNDSTNESVSLTGICIENLFQDK